MERTVVQGKAKRKSPISLQPLLEKVLPSDWDKGHSHLFKDKVNPQEKDRRHLLQKEKGHLLDKEKEHLLQKEKGYLPSRYAHQITPLKNVFQDVLHTIQINSKSTDIIKATLTNPTSPVANLGKSSSHLRLRKDLSQHKLRALRKEDVKLQPIREERKQYKLQLGKKQDPKTLFSKKEESKGVKKQEAQNFEQIFLEPKMRQLQRMKEAGSEQGMHAKQLVKDYDKLLQFETGKEVMEKEQFSDSEVNKHYEECIKLLEQDESTNRGTDFYQQQMGIQPPDMPNSSVASTLTPGGGYAPSVPLSFTTTNRKAKLTELLMRAKAGATTEDVQKEAHLSFYLGTVYEDRQQYTPALRFYRRFLGFARALQDKIGMCLGANRVAMAYYYLNDIDKSIAFHHENMKLADADNCFAAYYNLGICHRKAGRGEDALEFFDTALQWAIHSGEAESECIALGQLGVTYQTMELYQEALNNFQKSVQLCRKLRNNKLLQLNLQSIMLIACRYHLKARNSIEAFAQQAYECSKTLEQQKTHQLLACNIGIIKGFSSFQTHSSTALFSQDCEQFVQNQEQRHSLQQKIDPAKQLKNNIQNQQQAKLQDEQTKHIGIKSQQNNIKRQGKDSNDN